MNERCLRELAYWLSNNTIVFGNDVPKIFTGVEQDKLEEFLKGEYNVERKKSFTTD